MTTTRLGQNSYGKSRVRVLKVLRDDDRHEIRELSVDIALSGDFEAVHTRGDNTKCLPTDTMKNTVYALAKDDPLTSIEEFAARLAAHFVESHRPATLARVTVEEAAWKRATVDGSRHPHAFIRGSEERALCEVTLENGSTSVRSGLCGLVILKSADSAFSGFARDRYTTLNATEDRIFCTSVTTWWRSSPTSKPDYAATREPARRALIETFADHKSKSVQQTLYAMGQAVLARCPAVERIELSMPNKHCLLVDLAPFGLENRNEVFVPTDEPHGLIEATVERV